MNEKLKKRRGWDECNPSLLSFPPVLSHVRQLYYNKFQLRRMDERVHHLGAGLGVDARQQRMREKGSAVMQASVKSMTSIVATE